jgi:UDP-3-O-[3-hydroxymyristoyl] glucosamine N-acyltransferase
MIFTAAQIAMIIHGRVEGDASVAVSSFGKIEEAKKGQIAFLANPKYEEYLYITHASVVIVNESLQLKKPVEATLIRVEDAYTAFATMLAKYQSVIRQQMNGIQQPSYIAASAVYGENIFIGAFSYIGEKVVLGNDTKIYPGAYIGDNVKIGNNTVIHPGVRIYHDSIIGNDVIIHAGTIIGGDGFGFAPQKDGSFQKVPQIGNVIIEDNVEIGANTAIDRATLGSTIIRSGAKLDNLIQVAHNVEIGNESVIASQVGISGSTKIGKHVMIGGQAGLVGHIHVGDGAKINGQSGISKSVEAGQAVTGSPAYDYTSALRSQAVARKLPEMEKRIKELEEAVKKLNKF